MRILIATTQVPFIRGGAEILAEGLVKTLTEAGHQAEIAAIPFKWYPPERILDSMLACRLLDISESCGEEIDKVIGLKFPAYLIPHPNKVIWLLHQHRTAYELWGTALGDLETFPNGLSVKESIRKADNQSFSESRCIYTIAKNVSKRLKRFNDLDSTALYHPPKNANLFYCEDYLDYFFFPSRLNPIKRQELVIQALEKTEKPVKVIFAGQAEPQEYYNRLISLAKSLGVLDRAKFLGKITEQEKIQYYAKALGVIYPPFDEDYGYVTLEAMLSSKPVITCQDSGGSLEFVKNQETGIVTEPDPLALASAMDEIWKNTSLAKTLGQSGREHYFSLNITWSNVVHQLLS